MDEAFQQRAARRRRTWRAEVVDVGEAKPSPYADMSVAERLAAFIDLNRRVWTSLGYEWDAPADRGEMPGEILDLRAGER